jgi:hypothetical protein
VKSLKNHPDKSTVVMNVVASAPGQAMADSTSNKARKMERYYPLNTNIRFSNPLLYRKIVHLLHSGNKTRDVLCIGTRQPHTTVYDVLRKMMSNGQVSWETANEPGQKGRSKVQFMLTEQFLLSDACKDIINIS